MTNNWGVLCDKCNKPVIPCEDATVLASVLISDPIFFFFCQPRHIRCSPSRAQYIVHPDFEPVIDDRPKWDKRLLPEEVRKDREEEHTKAWLITREIGTDVTLFPSLISKSKE
jgi:hypothetical protein